MRKSVFLMTLLSCAVAVQAAAATSPPGPQAITALADELLTHLQDTSAFVRLQNGLPIGTLDPLTFQSAQAAAKFNQRMLARIDAIDLEKLPHEQWLLAKTLRHTFQTGAFADRSYWLEFAVTPYAGGLRISGIHALLAAQPLKTAADLDHYLRLLDSYAVMLDQVAAKTRAQADRGIRVPQPAMAGVLATFHALRASASHTLAPTPARLTDVAAPQAATFNAAVQERLNTRILPKYDVIVGLFDDAYVRAAPQEVGISRYPDGKALYPLLITGFTGLSLSAQQIRDLGERQVAELDRGMQAIREQLGFKGSREEFQEMLRHDPRFIAKSPAEVEKRYLGYIARIEPLLPQYFSTLPKALYGVRRLPIAAEKGMTYGYYEPPTPADPVGHYNYNGSDLDKRTLITAQHLIYHELVPGHHLQVALQLENPNTHPVRKFLTNDAFQEGWAEYAASLGEEMGLYSDPYDRYGHLLMQAFLASHLVVDTGMNYLNMPLAEARAYMKAHTFESDVQIESETLCYSTDEFAFGLSYWLGYEKFWELRHRAEQALGKRFDIREFHAAAIAEGSMSLDVLEGQIDWYIAQHRN